MKALRLAISQIYIGNYIFVEKLILNTWQEIQLKFADAFRSLGKIKISSKIVCVAFLNYPQLIIKMHYTFSMYFLSSYLSN